MSCKEQKSNTGGGNGKHGKHYIPPNQKKQKQRKRKASLRNEQKKAEALKLHNEKNDIQKTEASAKREANKQSALIKRGAQKQAKLIDYYKREITGLQNIKESIINLKEKTLCNIDMSYSVMMTTSKLEGLIVKAISRVTRAIQELQFLCLILKNNLLLDKIIPLPNNNIRIIISKSKLWTFSILYPYPLYRKGMTKHHNPCESTDGCEFVNNGINFKMYTWCIEKDKMLMLNSTNIHNILCSDTNTLETKLQMFTLVSALQEITYDAFINKINYAINCINGNCKDCFGTSCFGIQ
jgi:hypothetical protein